MDISVADILIRHKNLVGVSFFLFSYLKSYIINLPNPLNIHSRLTERLSNMSIKIASMSYDLLSRDAQKTALRTLLSSDYYRGVVEDNLSDDIYNYFEAPDATSYPVYVSISLTPVPDRPLLPSHQVRVYVEACGTADVLDFFERVLGEKSPLDHPDDVSIVCHYRTDTLDVENVTLDIATHDDDVALLENFIPSMNMWWYELYTDIENLVTDKTENDYYTNDGAYHHIINHPELSFTPNGELIDPSAIDDENDANEESEWAAS